MKRQYVVCNGTYEQNWFWSLTEAQRYADACQALHGYPKSRFIVRYRKRIVYDAVVKG